MSCLATMAREVPAYPLHVVLLSQMVSNPLTQRNQLFVLRPQNDVLGAKLRDVTLRHLQELVLSLYALTQI